VGRVLDGRYRVTGRIARGGMATVYEAHDLRLNRDCAVKVMHGALGDDPAFGARFVREAHSAAKLSHPNVVSVSDMGDDGGRLFIVMEHVPGRTLRDVVREEAPMPPGRALGLLEPVLLALAEAHRSGIVHRDVKPENVLIGDDGRIKVADFGLARAFDVDSTHTATGGVLIGTVSYLAPEVIVDGRADPRADVYAAGVLLYEMLTRRKPHEGDGPIQVAYKHVNEDVPPPSLCLTGAVPGSPALPSYVDALVQRATSRDRDRRPADAKVMLQQLRQVRAAVEAGVAEDPELTADLLPTVLGTMADSIDYVRDPATGAGAAAQGMALDPDRTTVIRQPTHDRGGVLVEGPDEHAWLEEPLAVAAAGRTVGHARPAGAPPESFPAPEVRKPSAPYPAVGRPAGLPAGAAGGRTGATARPRRRRRLGRGPVLLLVVLLLTALAAYAGWWFGIGRYTSTPGVLNQSVAQASAKLHDAGLDLEVQGRRFSETVPAGSIISTDPAAGSRVLDGATVAAVVSKGQERYAVPHLAGQPLTDAPTLLAPQHLTLGTVTRRWNGTVPSGAVIAASPSAGTEVRKDSSVDVTVSKGPRPIPIRDFTGRPAAHAEERLRALGFTVEVTEQHSDSVPEGRVVSQDPSQGNGHRGDTIGLVRSQGPVLVEVPELQTKSVTEARAELEALGLKIAVHRTQLYVYLDRVVRQDPAAGTAIPKGSTVTVSVV
jgi:beta-lactam-binding protein with PASTA domain